MALDQSALTDLLDALRAGGDLDFMREAMQLVLQALIELEATQVIGAERYERTGTRSTHRNGSRARLLSTKAGDVELAIPKLRHGSFFPALLEPRRRIDRALWAVIMEAFVHGVSTRKVDDLVAALGIDAGVSKSQVSRICAELDAAVTEFRERRLDHICFPYVFLDATYVKAHEGARVVAKAIIVAAAVRTIFAQPDAAAVGDQLDSIAAKLGRQFPAVEAMLREAAVDICAFTAFPQVHWKKLWSTNPVRHEAPFDRAEMKGLRP